MNQLINHITYLLDHHMCVTVPGLGTFLVHNAPAHIDYFSKSIFPPSRMVTFNSEADFEDSLLVSSYARKNSLNYSDALEMMRGDVATFKEMLLAGGCGILQGIGKVFMTPDKSLTFVGDDSSLSMQGLTAILIPENIKEEKKELQNDFSTVQFRTRFSSRIYALMKYAAMIVMFVSLAVIFSTPVNVDPSQDIVKANLCPFETDDVEDTCAPELLISHPTDNSLEISEDNAFDVVSHDIDLPREGDYILVIGSLATFSQAEQFIKDTGDDAIGLMELNGRFRVYGAFSSSPSELLKSSLMNKYPDAWLYHITTTNR